MELTKGVEASSRTKDLVSIGYILEPRVFLHARVASVDEWESHRLDEVCGLVCILINLGDVSHGRDMSHKTSCLSLVT
jgi:hypothetical protein